MRPINGLETAEFRIAPALYMRLFLARTLKLLWAPLLLATIAAILAAIFSGDLRWLILWLMLMLIVVPGLIAYGWFQISLTRASTLSSLNHKLRFSTTQVTPIMVETSEANEDGESHKSFRPRKPFLLSDCRKVDLTTSSIHADFGKEGILIIPYDVFADKEQCREAVELLQHKR